MNSNKIATPITEAQRAVSDIATPIATTTARTTDADRRNAKCLMKHFADFDQEGRTEIRKQVTFLVGYILPQEVLIIIKSYLLLDIRIYRRAQVFWTMNIPIYRMITIAEEQGVPTPVSDKMCGCLMPRPIPELTKGLPKMIYDAISKLPYDEQIRVYQVFVDYANQWRRRNSTQKDRLRYYVPYPTYVKKTVKAEHTRLVKKYNTFPIQNKIDNPDPAVYTADHRYADTVKTIIGRFPECASRATLTYTNARNQEYIDDAPEEIDGEPDGFDKIHMETQVYRNVVRCFDGTLEYIDRVLVDFGLSDMFLKDLHGGMRIHKINERIRIDNLGPRSPR